MYNQLLLSGKLMAHLHSIDEACEKRHEMMIPKMKVAEGVSESLKMTDQLEWVCRMNSIHHRIEEILLDELVYS